MRQRSEDRWRPLSEAPRDGTPILVQPGDACPVVVRYRGPKKGRIGAFGGWQDPTSNRYIICIELGQGFPRTAWIPLPRNGVRFNSRLLPPISATDPDREYCWECEELTTEHGDKYFTMRASK